MRKSTIINDPSQGFCKIGGDINFVNTKKISSHVASIFKLTLFLTTWLSTLSSQVACIGSGMMRYVFIEDTTILLSNSSSFACQSSLTLVRVLLNPLVRQHKFKKLFPFNIKNTFFGLQSRVIFSYGKKELLNARDMLFAKVRYDQHVINLHFHNISVDNFLKLIPSNIYRLHQCL